MENFTTSIRKKYIERRINRQRQWPPSLGDQLVELELVDDETKGQGYTGNQLRDRNSKATAKQTTLVRKDIFEGGGKRQIRRVLLEGEGGIGKTTLCTSISEDWADMQLFPQFEIVLLLPLRHEIVASADSLSSLLKLLHTSQDVLTSVVHYLEEDEGEHVLIIADGWDELSESQRIEGSFMYKLLFGELLPLVSVLLTSRPSASTMLHELQCIDRYVEVCGFSKKGIQEYIQAEFGNDKVKASRLLQQLENNPLVESVCSIPLNCAIICHLWRTLEGALPTTMTELYSKIILNLVFRNALKKNASKSEGVRSLYNFEALPENLQEPWQFLCKLAFQAISKNQIIFSEEELAITFSPPGTALNQKVLCFGLLQAAESILDVGRGVSFHFLHQTFQEYLAALYLVKQKPDKQLDFCQKHGKSDQISMLWRFYFGISFQCSQAVSVKLQKAIFSQLLYGQKLTICHCALESKDDSVTNLVAELFKAGELRLINPCNVNDCSAVINVIVNTQSSSSIVIDLVNCNLSDVHALILSDALVSKREKLQVEELNLSDNKLTDTGINLLIQRTPAVFSSLKMLDLSNNKISGNGLNTVLTIPPFANCVSLLTQISLWYNPLGVDGFKVLENAMCNGTLDNLEMLHLRGTLTDDASVNGSILISFTQVLLAHCHKFQYIDLSENTLGVPGAQAIGVAASQLAQQKVGFGMSLNEAKLGDEGVATFLQSLQGACPLSVLEMGGNNIHSAGASSLAKGISSGLLQLRAEGTLYSELSLNKNPVGIEGILAIGKMLSSCHCQLSMLSLSECQLTTITESDIESVGKHLCQMQPNKTITKVFVEHNSFTGKGVYVLAGLFHLCPNIEGIFTNKCKITSDDLKRLLNYLTQSHLYRLIFVAS